MQQKEVMIIVGVLLVGALLISQTKTEHVQAKITGQQFGGIPILFALNAPLFSCCWVGSYFAVPCDSQNKKVKLFKCEPGCDKKETSIPPSQQAYRGKWQPYTVTCVPWEDYWNYYGLPLFREIVPIGYRDMGWA